jgi:hypothetical protein
MSHFSPLRFWLFVRRTSPLDRIAAAVLALYLVTKLVSALGARIPAATFLAFLSFAALAYLAVRLIPWVRTKLLWRLRNRLIVAYVFMAVVPVVLLLAIVGLGLVLLELQIGAHLFRDDLQDRVSVIAADTDSIAAALNREPNLNVDQPVAPGSTAVQDPALLRPGVANIIAAAQTEWPDLRVYLNHGQQLVRAENGARFAGLAEFRGQIWFASAESLAVSKGQATLLVVAPITPALLNSFPSKLGPIQVSLLEPATSGTPKAFPVDSGHYYVIGEQVSSSHRALAPAANWFDVRIPGGATLEARKADTGGDATPRICRVRDGRGSYAHDHALSCRSLRRDPSRSPR